MKKNIKIRKKIVIYILDYYLDTEEQATIKKNETTPDAPSANTMLMEENEKKLMKEEEDLIEELKQIQDKHQNVTLIYDKVFDNLKTISKLKEKNTDDSIMHINLTESRLLDRSISTLQNQSLISEDDLLNKYFESLVNVKNTIDNMFLNNSKEEFLNSMKDRGYETVTNKVTVFKSPKKSPKISHKDFFSKPENTNIEYEYYDEDLKKEESEINKEKDEIVSKFKHIVIYYIIFLGEK